MLRRRALSEAMEYFHQLFGHSECTGISACMLKPYLLLVDKQGSRTEQQVAKLALTRATAKRIEWGNMPLHGFLSILETDGQLWLHPVLARK